MTALEPLEPEDLRILRLESPTVAGHTCKVAIFDRVPHAPPLELFRERVATRRALAQHVPTLISGGHRNAFASASEGDIQSRVCRGRSLSSAATRSRSCWECTPRSVRFGKYWRSSPFVFSLLPRCHGLRGSQK